ncbi:MAG: hypothetical protein IJQ78_07955, partial [Selenomonadaceae bacterium]|nr:hypothetical protein [Selenomonadaceae bacterium]
CAPSANTIAARTALTCFFMFIISLTVNIFPARLHSKVGNALQVNVFILASSSLVWQPLSEDFFVFGAHFHLLA